MVRLPRIMYNYITGALMKKSVFKPMNVTEFSEIVSELSYSKSSRIDNIDTRLIIDGMKGVPEVFVKVCNRSLESGTFPTSCKVARISVIPKKGDSRYLDNLRPLSILSILG